MFLNVYAPLVGNNLPVMVFLPGGRFEQSTGQTDLYDARLFANASQVVVGLTDAVLPSLEGRKTPGNGVEHASLGRGLLALGADQLLKEG